MDGQQEWGSKGKVGVIKKCFQVVVEGKTGGQTGEKVTIERMKHSLTKAIIAV